jgi:hypothetical protein
MAHLLQQAFLFLTVAIIYLYTTTAAVNRIEELNCEL